MSLVQADLKVPDPRVAVVEARRAVQSVEHLVRAGRLDGPAGAYWLTGTLGQLTRTLEDCLDELGQWWQHEAERGVVRVEDGPFAGEPDAAVAVTVQSLAAASAACAQAFAALERAQMAGAEASTTRPRRGVRRRWAGLRPASRVGSRPGSRRGRSARG